MDASRHLTVLYTCDSCGVSDRGVSVAAREADEDVVAWVGQVAVLVGRDHARVSPDCHVETLTNLKIPVSGADHIGGVTKQ